MTGYKELVRPVVELFDSELGHSAARKLLSVAQRWPDSISIFNAAFTGQERFRHPSLQASVLGMDFDGMVILAAGWDKNAEAAEGVLRLGFAGVEEGTILPWEQPGNPKPRQFRLPQGVTLNRLGFNNKGMVTASRNLIHYQNRRGVIGGSIGIPKEISEYPKLAPAIHAAVTLRIAPLVDYLALNVASPNTPKLRELLARQFLTDNLQAVDGALEQLGVNIPRLIKLPPDFTDQQIDEVIAVVDQEKWDGFIIANTTINPAIKKKYGDSFGGDFAGGLAGNDPEYRRMCNEMTRKVYQRAPGKVIFGSGGISDGPTALERIQSGASRVQVLSGMWSEGPFIARNIDMWLARWAHHNGVANLSEVVGKAT